MSGNQKHLNHQATVTLGAYYTPANIVDLVYNILLRHVDVRHYTIIDTSCGYGSFLKGKHEARRYVGIDIDDTAIEKAKISCSNVDFIYRNALYEVSREKFTLTREEMLIAIGNPPYNDKTSLIKNTIKTTATVPYIDKDIKTRDLGMSFLLSYDKITADYVCVLHPLSYLIKKANFNLLSKFTKHYRLIDGLIISSTEFSDTSRTMAFPILIALYKRDNAGMCYDYIQNYRFTIKEGGDLCLNDFDSIANYIHKYPNKHKITNTDEIVARFWTLRDINALKRNKTFIDKDTPNTVYVTRDKFPYYCYVDIFKQYADKMPYFIGNCDVIIDNERFEKIKECFVAQSVHTNPVLKNKIKFKDFPDTKMKVDEYFINITKELKELK